LNPERVTEYPSLVPTARVGWVQAIVIELSDIKNRIIALRQTIRHGGRLTSHLWLKCLWE